MTHLVGPMPTYRHATLPGPGAAAVSFSAQSHADGPYVLMCAATHRPAATLRCRVPHAGARRRCRSRTACPLPSPSTRYNLPLPAPRRYPSSSGLPRVCLANARLSPEDSLVPLPGLQRNHTIHRRRRRPHLGHPTSGTISAPPDLGLISAGAGRDLGSDTVEETEAQ